MELQKKFNQQGFRLTQPRRTVMSILETATVPLSPQTIHQRALEIQEDIGLVTVYRTLELLTDLNMVRRVHGPVECHGYVLASPGHHHHLICTNCEKTIEFSGGDEIQTLLDRIQVETDFKINHHLLQLFGLCGSCQKEKGKNEKIS